MCQFQVLNHKSKAQSKHTPSQHMFAALGGVLTFSLCNDVGFNCGGIQSVIIYLAINLNTFVGSDF